MSAVRESDIYVGIFGKSYSEITIGEYFEAVKSGKLCLTYVKEARDRDPRLQQFIDTELRRRFKYHRFKSKKFLYKQVKEDLESELVRLFREGLHVTEATKMKAKTIEKEVLTATTKLSQDEAIAEARNAFEDGRYLESIVHASAGLETAFKKTLSGVGRGSFDELPIGSLARMAASARLLGLITQEEIHLVDKLQSIRNAIMHRGSTPTEEDVAYTIEVASRLVDSLSRQQPTLATEILTVEADGSVKFRSDRVFQLSRKEVIALLMYALHPMPLGRSEISRLITMAWHKIDAGTVSAYLSSESQLGSIVFSEDGRYRLSGAGIDWVGREILPKLAPKEV